MPEQTSAPDDDPLGLLSAPEIPDFDEGDFRQTYVSSAAVITGFVGIVAALVFIAWLFKPDAPKVVYVQSTVPSAQPPKPETYQPRHLTLKFVVESIANDHRLELQDF